MDTCLMSMTWNTDGLTHSVVVPANPERTKRFIRAVQGHCHGVAINPNLFSLTVDSFQEPKFHTGSTSNLQIKPLGWSYGLVE